MRRNNSRRNPFTSLMEINTIIHTKMTHLQSLISTHSYTKWDLYLHEDRVREYHLNLKSSLVVNELYRDFYSE